MAIGSFLKPERDNPLLMFRPAGLGHFLAHLRVKSELASFKGPQSLKPYSLRSSDKELAVDE